MGSIPALVLAIGIATNARMLCDLIGARSSYKNDRGMV